MAGDEKVPDDLVREAARAMRVTPREMLGAGDYAQVWRATRERTSYALKVWEPNTLDAQEEHDALLRRAEALGFHDFMPRLIESGWGVSLVEYREGEELDRWVRTARPDQKAEVAARLVRFVDRMQRVGFDHGDLNTGNILVGPGLVVTLIDPLGAPRHTNMEGLAEVIEAMLLADAKPW